jgi:hypothetical protein
VIIVVSLPPASGTADSAPTSVASLPASLIAGGTTLASSEASREDGTPASSPFPLAYGVGGTIGTAPAAGHTHASLVGSQPGQSRSTYTSPTELLGTVVCSACWTTVFPALSPNTLICTPK